MRILGFDFDGGRLDISAHPFCGGVPQDVRITTRYNENDLLSALFGVTTKPATPATSRIYLARGSTSP